MTALSILVVDDDPDSPRALPRRDVQPGTAFHARGNGAEAVKRYSETKLTLAFSTSVCP
jgi:CheY-like chemotaxis protein